VINFSVNFKPGIPIYEQVIYAVKKAIVLGQLREGDPFPSVREISKELRINPNTAQKVVTNLVKEKLLEIKPGIGSMVSKLGNATEEQRHNILNSEVEKLVVEAKRLSIKKGELIEAIQNQWGKGK
jgi:GntR family transcriptional regulator